MADDEASRFSNFGKQIIEERTENSIPTNTKRTNQSVWTQFTSFFKTRNYELDSKLSVKTLADVLQEAGII